MKTKIFSILAIVLAFTTNVAKAQERDSTVHKSVTVTREFQPIINDAGKIIGNPQLTQADVQKTKPTYLDVTTPLRTSFNIHYLRANELLHTPIDAKKGFARVGFGYPLNSLADFIYPIVSNENNRLDFSLHHLGAFMDKVHSKTNANLQYNHLFSKFDLYSSISGSHDYFNYYGRSFAGETPIILSDVAASYPSRLYAAVNNPSKTVTLTQITAFPEFNTLWRVGGEVGMRSLPLSTDDFLFDFGFKYNHFNAVAHAIAEDHFNLNARFSVPFNLNRLGMDLELHHIVDNVAIPSSPTAANAYSVIKIAPYYLYEGDVFRMKLGAKTGLSGGNGWAITPSPDVNVEWNVWKDYVALYGGATGDLKINTLNSIYEENRYITHNTRIDDTYTPLDAFGGIKLSPVHNLMIDIYGQFKYIHNQYFYQNIRYITGAENPSNLDISNISHNRFNATYSTTRRTSAGARIAWDYKELVNIYAKGAYHIWDTKEAAAYHAWLMPQWDTDFGANIRINNDITVNTQFIFQDGRYARLSNPIGTKLTPIMDLNLSAAYSYRDWASFFLKANNILNKRYEVFSGYDVQGINAMAGVTFSF